MSLNSIVFHLFASLIEFEFDLGNDVDKPIKLEVDEDVEILEGDEESFLSYSEREADNFLPSFVGLFLFGF